MESAHRAQGIDRRDLLRRPRAGRPGTAAPPDGQAPSVGPPNRVGQPAEGEPPVRAACPRDGRCASLDRRVPPGSQPRQPGGAVAGPRRLSTGLGFESVGTSERPGRVRRMGRLTEPTEEGLLTYGEYLKVPELLSLQQLRSDPPVHD